MIVNKYDFNVLLIVATNMRLFFFKRFEDDSKNKFTFSTCSTISCLKLHQSCFFQFFSDIYN